MSRVLSVLFLKKCKGDNCPVSQLIFSTNYNLRLVAIKESPTLIIYCLRHGPLIATSSLTYLGFVGEGVWVVVLETLIQPCDHH